jgi:hypothetical protein
MKRLTVLLSLMNAAILASPALAQQTGGTPPTAAAKSSDKVSPKLMS